MAAYISHVPVNLNAAMSPLQASLLVSASQQQQQAEQKKGSTALAVVVAGVIGVAGYSVWRIVKK